MHTGQAHTSVNREQRVVRLVAERLLTKKNNEGKIRDVFAWTDKEVKRVTQSNTWGNDGSRIER